MDSLTKPLPIELNLEIIAASAEPAWADNWNFRSYLLRNVSPGDVDLKVKGIYENVVSQVDCTSCGNCCREIFPLMTADDVEKMARGLNITKNELLISTQPAEFDCVSFKSHPCPMLKENKCTVYQFRPRDCQEYPHLDKPDFLAGSIGTIENYGTCPIIFNVYNRLKSSFEYNPAIDYIGDSDPESSIS